MFVDGGGVLAHTMGDMGWECECCKVVMMLAAIAIANTVTHVPRPAFPRLGISSR